MNLGLINGWEPALQQAGATKQWYYSLLLRHIHDPADP